MTPRLIAKTALTFLALLPLTVRAESEVVPLRLSLQDCIDYALSHSDTIKNARLAVLKQHYRNNQIKSGALPQINGRGEFDAYTQVQQALLPAEFLDPTNPNAVGQFVPVQFTPKYQGNGSLTATQTIFDGTLLVALKARRTIMEVARQAASLTEQNVKYNIQRAYYAVIIGEEQFRTISRSLANARELQREMSIMYNTGVAEKIDVDRSEVQLTNLETDSLRTLSLLETGRQMLKYSIGMNIYQPIELTDTSLTDNVNSAVALVTEQLDYARRTEYRLANQTIKLGEYNLKRYQLSALPTLNAFGTMGANYGSDRFRDAASFNRYLNFSLVGIQLNVPIFSGLRRFNEVREARLDIELSRNRLHLLEQSLDYQTAQAQTTLRNALLASEKQKRNLELSNTILDLAQRKFKAGVGSNLEVNQAQTDLLISQNNYYNALLDIVNAQADVQLALGGFAQ